MVHPKNENWFKHRARGTSRGVGIGHKRDMCQFFKKDHTSNFSGFSGVLFYNIVD